MNVKVWLVAAVTLFLAPLDARAFPAPHFGEQLAGFIYPDPTDVTTRKAVTLNLDCYGPGEDFGFCGGTYRCRRAPSLHGFPPPPPPCRERNAKINFELNEITSTVCQEAVTRQAGLNTITFDGHFRDGVVCHFSGFTQQVLFSLRIPAIQGRYECRTTTGSPVESGIFAVQATSFKRLAQVVNH